MHIEQVPLVLCLQIVDKLTAGSCVGERGTHTFQCVIMATPWLTTNLTNVKKVVKHLTFCLGLVTFFN